MGPYSAQALGLIALLGVFTCAVSGQETGWHYSPLPGEGDRASMGCARGSTEQDYSCLVVRCEDDFSVGVHLHASRAGGVAGPWEITLDKETRQLDVLGDQGPYGGKVSDADGWLLDGLRHGGSVYLRHTSDDEAPFAFIDLTGSYQSISEALYWCAPRVAPNEHNDGRSVDPGQKMETDNE